MIECQLWSYFWDFTRICRAQWSLIYPRQCNNYSHLHTCEEQHKNRLTCSWWVVCVGVCTCLCMNKKISTWMYTCAWVLCCSTFIVLKQPKSWHLLFICVCLCVIPQETGFWFIFHHVPTGPSEGLYSPGHTEHTPMGQFTNNRAHSNYRVSLRTDRCWELGVARTLSMSQMCQYYIIQTLKHVLRHCCTQQKH